MVRSWRRRARSCRHNREASAAARHFAALADGAFTVPHSMCSQPTEPRSGAVGTDPDRVLHQSGVVAGLMTGLIGGGELIDAAHDHIAVIHSGVRSGVAGRSIIANGSRVSSSHATNG